jgi:hypothetical protein
MSVAWGIALATLVPFACLALLLFLDRLEQTLKESRRPTLKRIPARATTVPVERRSRRAA